MGTPLFGAWLNMLHSLMTLALISSSIHCQIKFSGVVSSRSTNTSSTIVTEFAFPPNPTNLPTPRSAVIRFPSFSTAPPSTSHPSPTPTTRLFALNQWGHIECKARTDCPPDVVDTEKKEVIKYSCEEPISQIIAKREGAGIGGASFAAPPENEDPAKTCAEDLTAYYCADPTRPGCELCPGLGPDHAGPVPGYCYQRTVFLGSPPNYLTGSVGQTVSSIAGLQQGQRGEDILPCAQ